MSSGWSGGDGVGVGEWLKRGKQGTTAVRWNVPGGERHRTPPTLCGVEKSGEGGAGRRYQGSAMEVLAQERGCDLKITAQCGECQIISGKKEPPTAYQIHVHGTNKRVQVFALYVVSGTSTPRQQVVGKVKVQRRTRWIR